MTPGILTAELTLQVSAHWAACVAFGNGFPEGWYSGGGSAQPSPGNKWKLNHSRKEEAAGYSPSQKTWDSALPAGCREICMCVNNTLFPKVSRVAECSFQQNKHAQGADYL